MTPTDDIERLIKTLNIKAGTELGARTIRDATEAMPDIETVGWLRSLSETWRNIMKSRLTKRAVAVAAVAISAVLATHYVGEAFHGSNVAWGAVIKPIFDARTAVLDIVIGSGGKQAMIHDEVMGSRIRRTLSSGPSADVGPGSEGKESSGAGQQGKDRRIHRAGGSRQDQQLHRASPKSDHGHSGKSGFPRGEQGHTGIEIAELRGVCSAEQGRDDHHLG